MTIAVVIFGLFMASLVGWIVRQSLGAQPWVATDVATTVLSPDDHARNTMRMMLVVVIAVGASIFGLFLSAYLIRMEYADWRPIPLPSLLWLNTAVLVACSIAMQAAHSAAGRNQPRALKAMLAVAGVLSIAFIVGQYQVWQQLYASGYYLGPHPASAFFFVLTAVHVLHLLGGLVAWGRTGLRVWGGAEPAAVRLAVELCAVYWHFLLAVWIVLFAMLSST
jgi:cytochrome c oxidase subunit III